MQYLRFKLRILSYRVRVNFSVRKEFKLKFLLSCFVKLATHVNLTNESLIAKSTFYIGTSWQVLIIAYFFTLTSFQCQTAQEFSIAD